MLIFDKIKEILLISEKPSKDIAKLMETIEFKESDFCILKKLENVPQDKKFHPEGNVFNHTKMVIDYAAALKELSQDEEEFMLGALFHDIGKLTTTKFVRGRYRSYNHDNEGEKVTYHILSKYMDDNKARRIAEIVKYHMHHIYILKELPFANVKGLLGSDKFNDILLVFICDKLGRGFEEINDKEETFKDLYVILEELEKNNNTRLINVREIIGNAKETILKTAKK